jgi:mxaJ protein
MSSHFRNSLLVWLFLLSGFGAAQTPLRVCADPDDLPFSSIKQSGFDNQIAQLLAHDLQRRAVFVWSRARRGFLREQFNKGVCDILMGVPEGMKRVQTTIPYYRSSYVFVTRNIDHLKLARFDDPAIGRQRIGLQILEEDFSPPSLPLIRSGHAAQFVGFDSFGDGGSRIVRAVAQKQIGFAVVWGPIAGYYAAKQHSSISLSPVRSTVDVSGIPFSFAITVAVHSGDSALATQLNNAIERHRADIYKILASYHVPLDNGDGGKQ